MKNFTQLLNQYQNILDDSNLSIQECRDILNKEFLKNKTKDFEEFFYKFIEIDNSHTLSKNRELAYPLFSLLIIRNRFTIKELMDIATLSPKLFREFLDLPKLANFVVPEHSISRFPSNVYSYFLNFSAGLFDHQMAVYKLEYRFREFLKYKKKLKNTIESVFQTLRPLIEQFAHRCHIIRVENMDIESTIQVLTHPINLPRSFLNLPRNFEFSGEQLEILSQMISSSPGALFQLKQGLSGCDTYEKDIDSYQIFIQETLRRTSLINEFGGEILWMNFFGFSRNFVRKYCDYLNTLDNYNQKMILQKFLQGMQEIFEYFDCDNIEERGVFRALLSYLKSTDQEKCFKDIQKLKICLKSEGIKKFLKKIGNTIINCNYRIHRNLIFSLIISFRENRDLANIHLPHLQCIFSCTRNYTNFREGAFSEIIKAMLEIIIRFNLNTENYLLSEIVLDNILEFRSVDLVNNLQSLSLALQSSHSERLIENLKETAAISTDLQAIFSEVACVMLYGIDHYPDLASMTPRLIQYCCELVGCRWGSRVSYENRLRGCYKDTISAKEIKALLYLSDISQALLDILFRRLLHGTGPMNVLNQTGQFADRAIKEVLEFLPIVKQEGAYRLWAIFILKIERNTAFSPYFLLKDFETLKLSEQRLRNANFNFQEIVEALNEEARTFVNSTANTLTLQHQTAVGGSIREEVYFDFD